MTSYTVPTAEEARLSDLLAAFPGDELAGRSDMLGDPYISPAQVKMAMRCPEQYRRRYVRGEKERPAGAMLWGSADHEAHEQNFSQKIVSGVDLPLGDVQDAFRDSLRKRVEREGGIREVEWKDDGDTLMGARRGYKQAIDHGVKVVAVYHETVSPSLAPYTVEERFKVDVPGVPVKILGMIDLVADVPTTPALDLERAAVERRIIERKTSGANKINGEWHVQGRIYQLVRPLTVDYHLSLKTKTPNVAFNTHLQAPMPERMVVAQLQRAIARIANCYLTYGPDEPWDDATGSAWACGFCAWGPKGLRDCPWWQPIYWNQGGDPA